MILEKLKVLKSDQSYMWLENNQKTSCGGCSHSNSCGVSSLSKVFKFNRNNILKLQNTINIKKNEWVEISIPDALLLKSSFLVYLLPILLMIAFAVIAKQLFGTELSSILGAGLGFLISAIVIKVLSFNLVLQKIINPNIIKVQ